MTALRCVDSGGTPSGGGVRFGTAFGSFCGRSTCALRLRFAALDLAILCRLDADFTSSQVYGYFCPGIPTTGLHSNYVSHGHFPNWAERSRLFCSQNQVVEHLVNVYMYVVRLVAYRTAIRVSHQRSGPSDPSILATAMDEHCHCFLSPGARVGQIFGEESFPCPDKWPFHEFSPTSLR